MPDSPPAGVPLRPVGPPVGTIILLVLAVVLYSAMMGSLADAPRSDAMGRGLATAFGAIFATLLMIVLAILLLVAALKGGMSPAGKAGAVILLPVATVAIWMAAEAYGSGDHSAFLIPALLPPLFALYAVRARFAVLRQKVNGLATDIVIGAAIVILAGAPIARVAFPPPRDLEAEARGAAAEQERMAREQKVQEEARARDQAAFAALGPDSSMADYLVASGRLKAVSDPMDYTFTAPVAAADPALVKVQGKTKI